MNPLFICEVCFLLHFCLDTNTDDAFACQHPRNEPMTINIRAEQKAHDDAIACQDQRIKTISTPESRVSVGVRLENYYCKLKPQRTIDAHIHNKFRQQFSLCPLCSHDDLPLSVSGFSTLWLRIKQLADFSDNQSLF
ncbi:hypothetical protein OO013_15120 [Mangrovivirga sp. M17]|uniref:Uncharacterized protein n=1 Tax=Mangrovivirga halotolerans TaxID=2993936 RepID=A0ABT3RVM5_9BACT|nr:hypothetical protein [Mangrovivirga halotolerans]MCX2745210.1 hypothetical protein [Mangrovivirga halotolerans]